jgi:hypothetical protein
MILLYEQSTTRAHAREKAAKIVELPNEMVRTEREKARQLRGGKFTGVGSDVGAGPGSSMVAAVATVVAVAAAGGGSSSGWSRPQLQQSLTSRQRLQRSSFGRRRRRRRRRYYGNGGTMKVV